MQRCLDAWLLGASTGIMEGPQETEQTKIASSSLLPRELAGCGGDREPQDLTSSERIVDSCSAGWGGAGLGPQPPILQPPVPT